MMDKEPPDLEALPPTTSTDEDTTVRLAVIELKPLLERTDTKYELVDHQLGQTANDTNDCTVTAFAHDLSSRQAVIAAVREAHRKYKDADASLETAESAAAAARAVAYSRRVELGRALIEARKLFPASGPKAKGWNELLQSEGLPRQTALDYMKLAGFAEEVPTPRREKPSYRKLGIKRDKAAPSLADHLTSVLADLETRLIEASTEECKVVVATLEKWLEAYR